MFQLMNHWNGTILEILLTDIDVTVLNSSSVVMDVCSEGTVTVATLRDVISEVAIEISTLVVGGSLFSD